jgi:hypothetical protein
MEGNVNAHLESKRKAVVGATAIAQPAQKRQKRLHECGKCRGKRWEGERAACVYCT